MEAIEKLEDALNQIKTFMTDNKPVYDRIKAALSSVINPVIAGIKTVLDALIGALGQLESSLEDLDSFQGFVGNAKNLLDGAEGLLPEQKETIDTVRNVLETIGGEVPTADDIGNVIDLINEVKVML